MSEPRITVSVRDDLGFGVWAFLELNDMRVDERFLRPFYQEGDEDALLKLNEELATYRAALGHYHIVASVENHKKAILHFITAIEHFFGREAADVVRTAATI